MWPLLNLLKGADLSNMLDANNKPPRAKPMEMPQQQGDDMGDLAIGGNSGENAIRCARRCGLIQQQQDDSDSDDDDDDDFCIKNADDDVNQLAYATKKHFYPTSKKKKKRALEEEEEEIIEEEMVYLEKDQMLDIYNQWTMQLQQQQQQHPWNDDHWACILMCVFYLMECLTVDQEDPEPFSLIIQGGGGLARPRVSLLAFLAF